MRDWSQLNCDLLGEIVLKLAAIEDFVYFSLVCRSWNRACSLVKFIWKPSMPCLLLAAVYYKEKPNYRRKVYSLNSDRCYELNLPHIYRARYWGSACGWIATEFFVINPFTNAKIRFPPQAIQWYDETPVDDEDEFADIYQEISIRKVIVLKDDDDDKKGNHGNGLIVFAMHTDWRRLLVFSRPGDKTWSSVIPPWPLTRSRRAADIVRKDRLILILYEDASVGYLDLSELSKSTDSEQFVQAKEFFPCPGDFKGRLSGLHLLEMYLVESSGSLLMVLRHKSTDRVPDSQVTEDEVYKTVRFEVFGINFKTKKWDPIKNLGDAALFVGDNQSMSVKASDCRNCKCNCIYFTDDCDELWDLPVHLGGHDMGFYNLEDGEIYQFYRGGNARYSGYCTPFWFVPHF